MTESTAAGGEPSASESEAGAADRGGSGSVVSDVVNVVRGFFMGAADTVPGVSGGTVALILGHYERWVTAISHVDGELIQLVRQKRFREAAMHVDLRFLVALVLGVLIGIASLSQVMHWLLDHRFSETMAVFFGLMIASVWIVQSLIERWSTSRLIGLGFGVAAAVGITLLPIQQGSMSLPFLFGSACIAICAMILPGISGAFILVLLGVYRGITGLVKDTARLNITFESIVQLTVFGLGCVFGLLAFSRVLRWLLTHHHDVTMAALIGLMIGSVGKLWPLQQATPETADLEPKFRVMQYIAPQNWDGSLLTLAALMIAAAVAVLALERIATKRSTT